MSYDLTITNALLVDHEGMRRGSLAVRAGKIAAVFAGAPDAPTAETIDAGGMPLLPGLVDAHVHFNQPGRDDWEGFETGSMSAAAGGVTTVIDMPLNCDPVITNAATLAAKFQSLADSSLVDYLLWGGLVTDNVAQLAEQVAGGAVALKAFMSTSGINDFPAVTDGVLYDGLREAARLDTIVGVHAESDSLTAYLTDKLRAAGRRDRRAWLEARPPLAELEAIQRAILLASAANARLHIVHVSTAEGIAMVNAARRAGHAITCETCAHFLSLDEEDFVRIGPDAKCAPPLRSRAHVEALWQQVLDGNVDLITSDHSPCPTADKRKGDDDIWEAWGGIGAVQLTLPLLLDEGVHRRGLSLPQLVRLTSTRPAQLFGIYPTKGSLQPGADADLTLIDPDATWVVEADRLFARHKHSPFLGRSLRGKVRATLVRGRVVFRDDAIVAERGWGQRIEF